MSMVRDQPAVGAGIGARRKQQAIRYDRDEIAQVVESGYTIKNMNRRKFFATAIAFIAVLFRRKPKLNAYEVRPGLYRFEPAPGWPLMVGHFIRELYT